MNWITGSATPAGWLSGSGSKDFTTQKTTPDADAPLGKEYIREAASNVNFTVKYETVPLAFALSVLALFYTPGSIFTAKYFYTEGDAASAETAEITGYLTNVQFDQQPGTRFCSLTVQLHALYFVAMINDTAITPAGGSAAS